jgi:hypothetical protein
LEAFSVVWPKHLLNHEILIDKLHFHGIQGTGENWCTPYLGDRKQKVEIKSANGAQNFFLSEWGTIQHGASHGQF